MILKPFFSSWLSIPAAFLVAGGLTARFYGLGINGFWYDELVSLVTGDPSRSFQAIILQTPANEVHPPLYVLLLAARRGFVQSRVDDDDQEVMRKVGLDAASTREVRFIQSKLLLAR